jgi:hypothetical protein
MVTLSETRGSEMCAKWVILGGLGREKGGEKGVFWAQKAGKKAPFCVAKEFLGQNQTLCHNVAVLGVTPGVGEKGETDATRGRSVLLHLREDLATGIFQGLKHANTLEGDRLENRITQPACGARLRRRSLPGSYDVACSTVRGRSSAGRANQRRRRRV